MTPDPRPLCGKTAVITGSATGIGRATAELFAANGADLILVDRKAEENKAVVSAVTGRGARARSYAADLADAEATASCVERIASDFPVIDVLINNAGELLVGTVESITLTAWAQTQHLHLTAPAAFILGLLPCLRAAPSAAIINNASIDGLFGHPLLPAYGTAKGGLVALTRNFAFGLGRHGIRINCIASGGIDTAMMQGVDEQGKHELVCATPLGRLGSPTEVAEVILFLATPASSFVTGAIVTVDGGRTAVTAGVAEVNPAANI
jgi:3-oxoacyl-[acyl-carrier protein] reductase